jgi:hypothetical protein
MHAVVLARRAIAPASGENKPDFGGRHAALPRLRQRRCADATRAWLKDFDLGVARIAEVKASVVLVIVLVAAFAAGCGSDAGEPVASQGTDEQPARASPEHLLSRDPYIGVSCRPSSSFACDRVGLAVWLREPAARVDAAIAGQEVELDDPEWSGPGKNGERRIAGFLQPAGLIDGPLELAPDAGPDRWFGREPVSATVQLWIVDGGATTTTVEVGLSPGWG